MISRLIICCFLISGTKRDELHKSNIDQSSPLHQPVKTLKKEVFNRKANIYFNHQLLYKKIILIYTICYFSYRHSSTPPLCLRGLF